MKFPLKFLSFVLLFCLKSFCFGQTFIEGTTQDEQFKPLPFVSFYYKQQFVGMSNELGQFKIAIIDSLPFDTLHSNYLGYLSSFIDVSDYLLTNQKEIILRLPTASLRKPKPKYKFIKTKFAGAETDISKDIYFKSPSSIVGLYLKNHFPKEAFLKNVQFYITNNGFTETKFRIHVYEANADGIPIKELLDSNYFANAIDGGNEWVSVDLSAEKIQFPTNGLVIGMEWLINEKKLDVTYVLDSQRTALVGPCLGGTWEFNEHLEVHTNGYNKWFKAWQPADIELLKHLNPMIRAEFYLLQ